MFLLLPENNLGNEAQIISVEMLKKPAVNVISEGEQRYGVPTHNNKHYYIRHAAKKLGDDKFFYHDHLVVTSPFDTVSSPQQKIDKVKREFERQMRGFETRIVLPKTPKGSKYTIHGGKFNDDNQVVANKHDDIAMALMLGLYWSGCHITGLTHLHERAFSTRLATLDDRLEERAAKRRRI